MVVENARGDELEGVLLRADDDRVPRIVSTLVSSHDVMLTGEKIDDLRFAFITPLGSDDDGDRHAALLGGDEPHATCRVRR